MHPHRRQFVIGPQKFILNQFWKTHQIDDSKWLSYCSGLRVVQATDKDKRNWYILGFAIETNPQRASIEDGITQATSDEVPELCSAWAGRWLLVGREQLNLDASGLLGCFYGFDDSNQVWASSSATLLAEILFPDGRISVDNRKLSYEIGISWYTPPRSRFTQISRLLPSQVLDLESGKLEVKPLMPKFSLDRDYEDVLGQIQQILVTTLQRIAQLSPELWLGLTAGYDSRLMLALSQTAGIKVKTFTRIATRMSVADKVLPPQLARTCGYSHIFLHRYKRFPERQALVETHSGGQISTGDSEPFVRGDRDGLTGVAFGGHGFAIASGFYKLRELPATLDSASTGAQQIANLFQEPVNSTATAGLQDWLEWVLEHPQPNLDWRDRFFIEQRQAGWLSTKEQVYDLADLQRFPILNCAHLYSLLLSISEEKRLGSKIQAELIRKVCPDLTAYTFNPNDFYFGLLQLFTSKAKDLPGYVYGKTVTKFHYFLRSFTA